MDQFKIFLAVVKKYQFWVLCGILFCTSLACWYLATSDLAGLFQKRKLAVKDDFANVQMIHRGHPNDKVIEYVRGRNDTLKQGVFTAWETLYKQQKANNPFPVKELGQDFKEAFEKLQLQPKGELLKKFRERYREFIKNYLSNLKNEVDARRPADSAADVAKPAATNGNVPGMSGREAAANANVESIGTVDWNPADYKRLESRFEWPGQLPPTTLAVVLAQEDLWVYEALLRVIHGVNETGLAVKRIEAIDISKDAAVSWEAAADTVVRGPSLTGHPVHVRSGGLGEQNDPIRLLLENRYIDDKDQPVPPIPEYPFARHPYSEFKMMPVRLKLVMDQRYLPSLLAECANSSMPIEVRRVRICKTQSTPLELAATSVQHGNTPSEPGYRSTAPEPGGGGESQELGLDDVPVEIYAVIYILNPPDREKLGVRAASEKNPAEPPTGTPPGSPLPPPKR